MLERVEDVTLFHLFEGKRHVRVGRRHPRQLQCLQVRQPNVLAVQHGPGRHGHGALDDVAELADISRPVIRLHLLQGVGRKATDLLARFLAKVIVDLPHCIRGNLVLKDNRARRKASLFHSAEVQHTLLGDVARIDTDADLIRFRMIADHAQRVLQSHRLRVDQVAKQRSLSHRRDEAVHHFVLRCCQRTIKRLGGAHHLMPDGAGRTK